MSSLNKLERARELLNTVDDARGRAALEQHTEVLRLLTEVTTEVRDRKAQVSLRLRGERAPRPPSEFHLQPINKAIRGYWIERGVSAQVANVLARNAIADLKQLACYSERGFLRMPYCGRKALKQAREALHDHNLRFQPEPAASITEEL
jgi:DNA-directed RNA polymerase alpha subunit